MVYRYGEQIARGHKNLKKYIAAGVTSLIMAAGAAVPAFAAQMTAAVTV